ncbi:MAG TPA: hypothetical protein VER58_14065 [Thermoanaerobaculia bacterium]|nr:hypothetical protein [Thermoanaerobaculia bacterium]
MAEIKLFQICHEGDLTVDLSRAVRRLGAEPTFDQSWHVWLTEQRHAAPLLRWLRPHVAPDARILVACTQFTTARDFLMIRHSTTPNANYRELHEAIARLGVVVDLPFESTFVIQSDDRTDVATLGAALGELCPDDSLMVVGISHDWAYCDSGVSRMNMPQLRTSPDVGRA